MAHVLASQEICPSKKETFLKCPRGVIRNLDIQRIKTEYIVPPFARTALRKRVDTNYFPRAEAIASCLAILSATWITIFSSARPPRYVVCTIAPLFRHTHTSRFACDGWRYAPDNERIAAGVAYASINITRPRDMWRAWRSIRVDFCTQESLTRGHTHTHTHTQTERERERERKIRI